MRPLITPDYRVLLRITEYEREIYASVLRGEYPKLAEQTNELMKKRKYSDVVKLFSLPLAGIPEDSEVMEDYAIRVAYNSAVTAINAVNDLAVFVGKREHSVLSILSNTLSFLTVKGVCSDTEIVGLMFSLLDIMFGREGESNKCLGYLEFSVPNIISNLFGLAESLAGRTELKDPSSFAEALLIKALRSLPDSAVYILPVELSPLVGRKAVISNSQPQSDYQLSEVKDHILRRLLKATTAFKALEKLDSFNSVEEWNSFVTQVKRELAPVP